MFEEFIKNQYVISLLNQYKEKDWLRVSYAIYIYGAKHFQEKYPNIISDLNAIERIVYKSPKEFNNDTISERKKLAMTKFFEGIKNKKGNKPEELSPEQTNKQLKKNKENISKLGKNIWSAVRNSYSPETAGSNLLKIYTKKDNIMAVSNDALNFHELPKDYSCRTTDLRSENIGLVKYRKPLIVTKIREIRQNNVNKKRDNTITIKTSKHPIIKETPKTHRIRSKTKDASLIREDIIGKKDHNKVSERKIKVETCRGKEPSISPKYLMNVESKIKNQLNFDKSQSKKKDSTRNHIDNKYKSLPRHNDNHSSAIKDNILADYLNNPIINHFSKDDSISMGKRKLSESKPKQRIWEEKIVEEESSYATTEENFSMTSYASSNASKVSFNKRQNKFGESKNENNEFCLNNKFKNYYDSSNRNGVPMLNNYII